jgi:outer membrane protein OmpA-like peptidoglycan-associated protein
MARMVGHTDNICSAAQDIQLSQEQAMVVAREMISTGTIAARITFSGRSYNEPITTAPP